MTTKTTEAERATNDTRSSLESTYGNDNLPQLIERSIINLPAVVACGYKCIEIQKSGNVFPAFLVAFEGSKHPGNDEDGEKPINAEKNSSDVGIRFAWRTKKDFLLLARKGGAEQKQSLPKAALKKVVSFVPWKRFHPSAIDQGFLHQRLGNNIPNCLCDKNLPNHISARMKKSIWQLDRFLQSMHRIAGNNEKLQNAWDVFARHADTEDLVTPKEFSTPGILDSAKNNTIDQRCVDDMNKRPFGNLTAAKNTSLNEKSETPTTLKESSRLGQYFASKDNSRKVVECALEKILPLYNHRHAVLDKRNHNMPKILFVEPSCGHGDIIVSLIEALKERKTQPNSVWIMGYDIDPAAINICRQRKEFRLELDKSSSSRNEGIGDYPIIWECKSFFNTTLESCIHNFNMLSQKDSVQPDCTPITHEGDTRTGKQDILVCCLGGPPYTTGQGSGKAIERDLPEQFVNHCFTEWKATVVSFLLPARYKRGMNKLLDNRKAASKPQIGTILATEGPTDRKRKLWSNEIVELEESTFFFRGTIKVTQPSIIQIFYEEETWS